MSNLGHFINGYPVKNVKGMHSTAYKNTRAYVKRQLKKNSVACFLRSEENKNYREKMPS